MKKMILNTRSVLAIGLVGLLTIFTACSKNDNKVQPNIDVAGFMAFNLVTDVQGVGVELSGNQVGPIMPYMGYTGGYVKAFPGERSTDAFAGESHNTLASDTYNYKANQFYSLFVIGTEGDYENVIVNDGLDTLDAQEGKSYFRFINALSNKAELTIKVANDTAEVFSEEADYGVISPFAALDSGSVTVSIEGDNNITKEREVNLEGQKVYTFLIVGDSDSEETEKEVQIRYIENGTLTMDSTAVDAPDNTK